MKILIDTHLRAITEATGHRVTLTLIDGTMITLIEPTNVGDGLHISVNGKMTIHPSGDNSCVIIGE